MVRLLFAVVFIRFVVRSGCALLFYEPLELAADDDVGASSSSSSSPERTVNTGTKVMNILGTATVFAPRCLCLVSHWPFFAQMEAYDHSPTH